MKLSEHVLRVLITKADHLNPEEMDAVEPQPIQPAKSGNPGTGPPMMIARPPRDDRGRAMTGRPR